MSWLEDTVRNKSSAALEDMQRRSPDYPEATQAAVQAELARRKGLPPSGPAAPEGGAQTSLAAGTLDPAAFKSRYERWKLDRIETIDRRLAEATFVCPGCNQPFEPSARCAFCGAEYGISRAKRLDVVLGAVMQSAGEILIYLLLIGGSIALRTTMGLGLWPTVIVVFVGGPWLWKSIRAELREAQKALDNDAAPTSVGQGTLLALAKSYASSGSVVLATRSYCRALAKGECSYSRMHPADLEAFWAGILGPCESVPADIKSVFQELACADAMYCHVFTMRPIDLPMAYWSSALRRVTAGCSAARDFAELLAGLYGPEQLLASRRVSTLAEAISSSAPEAARLLTSPQ